MLLDSGCDTFCPKTIGGRAKPKTKEIYFQLLFLFQLQKFLLQAVPLATVFKERLVTYVEKDIQSYNS